MQHSSLLTTLVRPFATAWAEQMAYKMGVNQEPNRLGQWLLDYGVPISNLVGSLIRNPIFRNASPQVKMERNID
jgi:hypothetical protein